MTPTTGTPPAPTPRPFKVGDPVYLRDEIAESGVDVFGIRPVTLAKLKGVRGKILNNGINFYVRFGPDNGWNLAPHHLIHAAEYEATPHPEAIAGLTEVLDRAIKLARRWTVKVNRVTSNWRHTRRVPANLLDALSDFQIDAEKETVLIEQLRSALPRPTGETAPDKDCALCRGTGFYGDRGPGGARFNREYIPCECRQRAAQPAAKEGEG